MGFYSNYKSPEAYSCMRVFNFIIVYLCGGGGGG